MADPLQLQIVERARTLIADEHNWCRGELARDVNGVGVCPMSDRAMRRCGLGALITAAYQITNDFDAAHDLHSKPCVHVTAPPHLSVLTT
jgi:hypothetical protein